MHWPPRQSTFLPAGAARGGRVLCKRATKRVTASIVVVCLGVGLSTVTDTQARYLYLCAGADTFHGGKMGSCRPMQRMAMPVQTAGGSFVAPARHLLLCTGPTYRKTLHR